MCVALPATIRIAAMAESAVSGTSRTANGKGNRQDGFSNVTERMSRKPKK